MRATFSLFLLLLAAAHAAPVMTTATFAFRHKDEKETLSVFWDGSSLRVEQPARRFGILFREKDGEVTGLEERDALYWKFNWPQISAAVGRQQNGKSLLNQNLPGLPASSHTADANAGVWLWHFDGGDGKYKNWEGAGEGTRTVEAQIPFSEKPDPQAPARLALWKRFAHAADIVRLVALRNLAPEGMEPLLASLPAEAGAPESLTWIEHGDTQAVMTLRDFRAGAARDAARFAVPKGYRETDLATLEGILKEAPAPAPPITGEEITPINKGDELMPTP